jgi:hypothetical protein
MREASLWTPIEVMRYAACALRFASCSGAVEAFAAPDVKEAHC